MKTCCYTCIFGGYDVLQPIAQPGEGIDYICFTNDLKKTVPGWKLRPIPKDLANLSPIKQQRLIKILPNKYLKEYDISIWVDGNIAVIGDLRKTFLSKYDLNMYPVYMRKHPTRDCIYEEQKAVVRLKRDTEANTKRQIETYRAEGFPAKFGLVESNVILRRHNDQRCAALMYRWAVQVVKGSHRDQLSFNYAVWRTGIKYGILDENLLTDENFRICRHGTTVPIKVVEKTKSGAELFAGETKAQKQVPAPTAPSLPVVEQNPTPTVSRFSGFPDPATRKPSGITEFDVVYVLGKGSSNGNAELRYSLRSVEKFMKGVRNVFVVGYDPGFLSDKVIYIPTVDPYPHDHANKDRNHWHNIETVCQDKRLSENFLFAADDNIILKDSTWDDFVPRHTGIANDRYLSHVNDVNIEEWTRTRIKTLLRFGKGFRYMWHPHMFSQINKTKFLQCCVDSDYRNRNDVVIFSYYYNHEPVPPPYKDFDTAEYHTAAPLRQNVRHISHWDEAFNYPPFRNVLDQLFPEKSKYEAFDMDKSSEIDLSIIIPCFNSEQYIDECMKSVLENGNRRNVEIICVNDGSTDGTLGKLKEYAEKHGNVRVFDLGSNHGLSFARNFCMEKARGRYIYFVDSDDRLAKGGIDLIVDEMYTNRLDMLSVCAKAFFDNDETAKKYARYTKYYDRPKMPKVMSGKDALRFFFSKNDNNNSSALFVYRREFLVNIMARFEEGIFYEDAPFVMRAMLNAKRVFNTTEKIYGRRVREGSIVTQKKNFKHFRSYLIASLLSVENIMRKCVVQDKELISYLMKFQVVPHFNNAANIIRKYREDKTVFSDMDSFKDKDMMLGIFARLEKSRKEYADFARELEVYRK